MAGDKRRPEAARRDQPLGGDAHRENRGLRVFRQRQLVLGPFEDRAAERLAKRRVGVLEGPAADGKRIGERAAHADLLRSLPGKDERDHWWGTAAAAISRSMRPMNPADANRCASPTPFCTAFALDRPWPTIVTPATPSSGAPPYSE